MTDHYDYYQHQQSEPPETFMYSVRSIGPDDLDQTYHDDLRRKGDHRYEQY
jgi:hypothetical protein